MKKSYEYEEWPFLCVQQQFDKDRRVLYVPAQCRQRDSERHLSLSMRLIRLVTKTYMDMMMPANKTSGENETTAWEAGGCSSKANIGQGQR